VIFTWDVLGSQYITVTAMNRGGAVTSTRLITVGEGITVDFNQGDTLVYTDTEGNRTIIRVPEGAVTESTSLIYSPVQSVTAPAGFSFAGRAFDLEAYRGGALLTDFTFDQAVTVTLHYVEADVEGLDEATLSLES
jgi:hypothetical protein